MRWCALAALLLTCCARAPVHEPSEPHSAPVETAVQATERNVELSADTTPPVRKSCKLKGPRLGARDRISGSIVVNYQVSAEGKVSGVAVQGDATEGAIRAVRRYLESCKYTPAMQAGKPVAVQWKGELNFPPR